MYCIYLFLIIYKIKSQAKCLKEKRLYLLYLKNYASAVNFRLQSNKI